MIFFFILIPSVDILSFILIYYNTTMFLQRDGREFRREDGRERRRVQTVAVRAGGQRGSERRRLSRPVPALSDGRAVTADRRRTDDNRLIKSVHRTGDWDAPPPLSASSLRLKSPFADRRHHRSRTRPTGLNGRFFFFSGVHWSQTSRAVCLNGRVAKFRKHCSDDDDKSRWVIPSYIFKI